MHRLFTFRFFLVLLFAAMFVAGGYAGSWVARADRLIMESEGDAPLMTLQNRMDRLEGGSAGKALQGKLLPGEKKPVSEKKLRSKKRLEEKKQKLEALKKEQEQQQVQAQPKKLGMLSKIREKQQLVNLIRRNQVFWNANAKEPLPDYVSVTVVGGELSTSQQAQLALAYRLFPPDFPRNVSLTVTFADPNMRNGMAGKGIIILKGQNEDLFFHTMVHEAGHAYGLRGGGAGSPSGFYDLEVPIPVDDPTAPYYAISWKDNVNAYNEAFPSLYAKSDPFEDFAEAFIYYIVQGKAFREESAKDPVIAKKYEFMKSMFRGKEFKGIANYSQIPYAIQELAFDPAGFFAMNQ